MKLVKTLHLTAFAVAVLSCSAAAGANCCETGSALRLFAVASTSDGDTPDLAYPPAGQTAPVIRIDQGEHNRGVTLTPEVARQRISKHQDMHYLIDKYFRLSYPGAGPVLENENAAAERTADRVSNTPQASVLALREVTPESPYSFGLLWRVAGKNGVVSHVFGTMHVDDPRITRLPSAVQQVFDQSHTLTIEALIDGPELIQVSGRLLLAGGQTLDRVIGNQLYGRLGTHLERRRIPPEFAKRLKPWAVAMLLGQHRSLDGVFLDQKLSLDAKRAGKPVFGLETLEEQLEIFDDMSMTEQKELLIETLKNMELYPALLETVTQAYLARDLGRLLDLSRETGGSRVERRLLRELVTVRNRKMAARMRPRLAEGRGFIAVGALHLPGADGILNILQRQGFMITRVY